VLSVNASSDERKEERKLSRSRGISDNRAELGREKRAVTLATTRANKSDTRLARDPELEARGHIKLTHPRTIN
jgi:hypothetical protein